RDSCSVETDVFALGNLLHELLSLAPQERWRSRADFDVITHTALRMQPGRRYSSVESLVQDVRRYRQSVPIQAGVKDRPRRWPLMAAALLCLTLSGGILATISRAHRAEQARAAAEAQRQVSDRQRELAQRAQQAAESARQDADAVRRMEQQRYRNERAFASSLVVDLYH